MRAMEHRGARRRLQRHDGRDRPARARRRCRCRSCARSASAGCSSRSCPSLVALTLLPVVLHTAGRALDWPHRRTDDDASRAWTRWARAVVRHRWVAALGAALRCSARSSWRRRTCTPGSRTSTRSPGPATRRTGWSRCERSGIGAGALLPHEISPAARRRGRRAPGRWRAWTASTARSRRHRRAGRPTARQLVEALPGPGRVLDAGRDLVGAVHDAAHGAAAEARLGRPAVAEPRLHRRGLRQLPADDRAHRADHVRAAGARVPVAAAARQGGGAEHR